MLGIRTVYKEDLIEMVYGSQIRISREFSTPNPRISQSEFIGQFQQRISNQKPTPATRHENRKTFICKEMNTTWFLIIRNEEQKETLQLTYEGPYQVIEKMGHEIEVSIDRLKPAHTIDDGNDTRRRKDSPLRETQGLPKRQKSIPTRSGKRVRCTERYLAGFTWNHQHDNPETVRNKHHYY